MSSKPDAGPLAKILEALTILEGLLDRLDAPPPDAKPKASSMRQSFLTKSDGVIGKLVQARELLHSYRFSPVEISLGSPEAIARFFALSFALKEKQPMEELIERPFLGSGVYAIYYHGRSESAYRAISGSETPVYIGKADPKTTYASDSEKQGPAIHTRIKEHMKSIRASALDPAEFLCKTAVIQSGMQYSVENFLIHLFKPIWNKEVGICHGLGKHGDSAKTRANKRSPWDTMHPGRRWAGETTHDQVAREDIVHRITEHFRSNPPV